MDKSFLDQIISYLPTIVNVGESLFKLVQTERKRLTQTGEWTADQEAQFLIVQDLRAKSAWQQPQG